MATEYKCNRHGDYKRLASAALCASDDLPSGLLKGKLPSSSPEDLKRFKAGLRESTIKARERVKVCSDLLSVINKCFPRIPTRKRSRPDGFSGDRSKVQTVGKMGAQSHALTSAFDYEQQKADVRPNTPARSSRSLERDREVVRLPNGNALQGADRVLPVVADGWEKPKMKKKRSVIKAVSKLGRYPTKKLLGRKAPRQKYSTFTATTDYLLHVSDDGHEELLAAANVVINPATVLYGSCYRYALSSPFWRLMDPRFRFVSDAAVAYVKHEVMDPVNTTDPIDSCYAHPNGTTSFETQENGNKSPKYLTSGGTSVC
nr:hypothetical protein [Tanacetum cinerariifolium]